MPNLDEIFIDYSADKLKQHTTRIEDCLGKLSHEQIWIRGSDNENAVGNLVLHLCGNVRQWIGYGVGGAADIRDRDSEFAARDNYSSAELAERLHETVDAALEVLRGMDGDKLLEVVTIQDYRVTKLEAVYQVVQHFAMHTGQIIFATKLLTRSDLGYYRHLSATAPVPRPDEKP